MVANETDRIQAFVGWSGSNQYGFTRPWLLMGEIPFNKLKYDREILHPTLADVAAGQFTRRWFYKDHTVLLQPGHVALYSRMLIHLSVHSWCHKDRLDASQIERRQ